MPAERVWDALNVLNERLVHAEAVGEALHAAAGDSAPPWVHVLSELIDQVKAAAEDLEVLVRPLCSPLDPVQRGVGGVAPDGDAAFASRDGHRGSGSRQAEQSTCPDGLSSSALS